MHIFSEREKEGGRPEETLFRRQVEAESLLFPLAGRPCLVATPFSGEPAHFTSARVFDGAWEPVLEKEKKGNGGSSEEERDGEEDRGDEKKD